MTNLDINYVLVSLLSGPEFRLPELPRTHGIYALVDHTGTTKYFGKAVKTDFRNRINSRHTTGSEGNSHKFSHTYNTGRMWRAKNDKGHDAKLVKEFRTAFVRHFCRARIFECQGNDDAISKLEKDVMALAPKDATEWNDRRSHTIVEPEEYVNEFLQTQGGGGNILEAMQRQLLASQSAAF